MAAYGCPEKSIHVVEPEKHSECIRNQASIIADSGRSLSAEGRASHA